MRNVVGEKVDQWEVVAKELGLPAPADHETAMVLDWKACQAWMRMGDTIRNWFRVQVAQGGMISGAQKEYFKEADPDFKVRGKLTTYGLEVAMLMRCVGILEATFAEHEAKLEREKYRMWDWDGTVHTPVFYTWWKAPEGWTKEQADVNEDEHEAWGQRGRLIAREFSFAWA
jgi:hypothetical protein